MSEPFQPSSPDRPALAVFDFDGTLSFHDSFLPFLRFALGNGVFFRKLWRMLLPSLGYLLHRLTRDELKGALVSVYLQGQSEQALKAKAQAYCDRVWHRLMRPQALAEVARQRASATQVTLCSASPELLLEPFAARLGVGLIGTRLEVRDGRLSGRLIGSNCRRQEKIERLRQAYGDLDRYHLRAWGDSDGDRELLARADEAYWKPFR